MSTILGAPGLAFETWEATEPHGHGTSRESPGAIDWFNSPLWKDMHGYKRYSDLKKSMGFSNMPALAIEIVKKEEAALPVGHICQSNMNGTAIAATAEAIRSISHSDRQKPEESTYHATS